MEDLVIYSRTYEEHINLLRMLFKTISDNNMSFNKNKTVFAKPTAIFAGYKVSADGLRPNPELTRAIREFPWPANITNLRSFYGLCQQVGNFSDKIAAVLALLSQLLKKNISWEWSANHVEAFHAACNTSAIVPELAFYDPSRPTPLAVDAPLESKQTSHQNIVFIYFFIVFIWIPELRYEKY
jgi:hypothetical protein